MRGVLFVLMLCGAGCGSRQATAPVAPKPLAGTFLDLQPGWRLRVITPLIAGGGYVVKPASAQEQGKTITLRTGTEFLGYETAYYDVREGLAVRFSGAETMRDGKSAPQPRPVHPLFRMSRGMKHMRLVFLERGSDAEHDMAILTSKNLPELDALTVRLRATPATACEKGCEWVPAGIAVRAETQRNGSWIPAR